MCWYLNNIMRQRGLLLTHLVKQLLEVAIHHLKEQIDPAFLFLFAAILVCRISLKDV